MENHGPYYIEIGPKFTIDPRVAFSWGVKVGACPPDSVPFDPLELGISAIRAIKKHRATLLPFLETVKIHFSWTSGQNILMHGQGKFLEKFGIALALNMSVVVHDRKKEQAEAADKLGRHFGVDQKMQISMSSTALVNKSQELDMIVATLRST